MAERGIPFGITAPKSVSFIAGSGTSLSYESLTTDEIDIFDLDLIKLAKYFSQNRDLQNLILEDRDTFLWAASIAKKQLAKGFGGNVPGSGEFGMQLIRSQSVLVATDWLRQYSASGWQNVFGSSASPVDLSVTTGLNPQNRLLLTFSKLLNTTVPKLTEIWFHIGPTDYPIWPTHWGAIGDLFAMGLPASPLIVKNGRWYMRGSVGSAIGVIDGSAPLGLAFADAEYMTGSDQES